MKVTEYTDKATGLTIKRYTASTRGFQKSKGQYGKITKRKFIKNPVVKVIYHSTTEG